MHTKKALTQKSVLFSALVSAPFLLIHSFLSAQVPASPQLTLNPISTTQIHLHWQDQSNNEEGFRIDRRRDDENNFQTIATLPANTTDFVDSGLTPNILYHYLLFAFNDAGDSNPSHVDSETANQDPANPPSAPTLSLTPVSSNEIRLDWTDNSNNEAGFRIERRRDDENNFQVIATVGPNTTSFRDTNLQANTLYHYHLFAFNVAGDSDVSHVDAATLPDDPTLTPPNAPTLSLTPVSDIQINLTWLDNSDNEDGFRIERRRDDENNFQVIATVGPNTTSFNDVGLTPNSLYHYHLYAFNAAGDSDVSHVDASTLAQPPLTPPDAPTLNLTPISSTQINLNWIDNSNNEDGFRIERRRDDENNFQVIATVGPNETSFNDTGLVPNTLYHYHLYAFNAAGDSDVSHVDASTLPDDPPVTPPNAPTLMLTPVSDTQINLTWLDNSDNEDGFRIERRRDDENNFQVIATVGPNTTSFNDVGLTPNSLYHYHLYAFNAAGDSDVSHVDASTLAQPPQTPPDAPTATLTPVSSTQINITWIDNSNNEDGFRIERRPDSDPNYQVIGTVGPNQTNFIDFALQPNTLYHYRIFAFNAAGDSDPSHVDASTLPEDPPLTPPNAPTLMLTPVSDTQINLTWLDNSDNEDGFRIERRRDDENNFQVIATVGPNTTSFNDVGLTPNSLYHYHLYAFNAAGDSDVSHVDASTLAQPPQTPPDAPTLSLTPISSTQINLTWIDNSNNEDGFRIERRRDDEANYQVVATVGPNVTSFNDTGLLPNTLYHYHLYAFNAAGDSDVSHVDASTLPDDPPLTPPSAPVLVLTPVSSTQINLIWLDSSDNEDGFRIERRRDDETDYQVIATVGTNVTSYMDTGLLPNTLYHYRLFAFNAAGDSDFSHVDATTFEDNNNVTPPDTPTLMLTPVSSTQINLSWIDNSNNEDGFRIERRRDDEADYQVIATLGPNVTSFMDTGLLPNTLYHYHLFAFNTAGDSDFSHLDASTLEEDNNQQTIEIVALEDVFIRAGRPNVNFEDREFLRIRGHDQRRRRAHALIKFNLSEIASAVGGRPIVSAHLQIHAVRVAARGGARPIIRVFSTECTFWDSEAVTWNTAPDSISLLDAAPVDQAGIDYQFDVGNYLRGQLMRSRTDEHDDCEDDEEEPPEDEETLSIRIKGRNNRARRVVDFARSFQDGGPRLIIQLGE